MAAQAIEADDRALLRLLMEDLRDHEIAELLYISVRTLNRRLDRLMRLAGAATRFGLGARAVTLGWLDPGRRRDDPASASTPRMDGSTA